MNSCLYDCQIVHNRKSPRRHRFGYRVFMFYLDLDELDSLARNLPWVSRNRFNVYSFNDRDHLQEGAATVKSNLLKYLEANGYNQGIGKIYLLTHLRTWGHLFNPVSFYFIQDTAGQPLCMVAEVSNTYKEQKLYLVGNDKIKAGAYRDQQSKHFYISPFSDLDTTIHFQVRPPENSLALAINESQNDSPYFFSSVKGIRKPLTQLNLIFYTVLFPLITLKILTSIHWQALRLFLKKIPVRAKASHPELQKDVRPYVKAH